MNMLPCLFFTYYWYLDLELTTGVINGAENTKYYILL